MANKKFTDLDPPGANPTLADADIMAVTLDPAGTPVSRKTSISNLMGKAPVQSVSGRTGAVNLSNTDIAGLGTAATTASTDYASATQGTTADSAVQPTDSIDVLADVDTSTVAPTNGQALVWDNTAGQWEPGPAGASTLDDLSDVTITSASNEDVIKFNGSSFVNGQVSVDVDTPLNTALRGTTSPHIGAYPNQSFKVIDNPYQSVMVVADEAGNLKLLNSLGVNNIAVGFSVVEDGTEPDIEVVSGSETYSVISGDSDSVGANGLPLRQGFNNPDIGANPAPTLISGGTIA